MTTTTAATTAFLREDRNHYAIVIANEIAAGRAPLPEDLAAYRTARDALLEHLGIAGA